MLQKKTSTNKIKFNYELEKSFSSNTLFINNNDIDKSLFSLNMMFEYIRYCYFENYIVYNPKKMEKYCRLLLRYENCNQSVLIKECQNLSKKILLNAINSPCSLKSIDLCFCFNESNYDFICDLCDELMTTALGTKVRALNK